jgi:amino acid adenylation domain-containing protein
VPPPAPLFTALLNYRHIQDSNASDISKTAWEGMDVLHGEERTNYPFTLSVNDFGEDFGLTAQVQKPIDPKRICGYMHTALENLMDSLEKAPQTAVRAIEVMSAGERQQVLYDWNATVSEYPKDKCIHELFEARVEKTPDAIAVVCEDQSMTYKELDKRANRLSHYLIELGVKPDTTVAIGVERSLEMVVGLLAILKAGGAYVPLDPAYPAERLEFMLKDSSPLALLTQSALKKRWSNSLTQVAVIELDAKTRPWEQLPASSPDPRELGLTPKHLAYVIYTSGSTGKPKGVMVEHANVVRLFSATDAWFHFGPDDVWTLFHSYAFDFSVWELWGSLLYGGRLIVVPQLTSRSPAEFYRLLCRQKVTVLNQTPSAFRQLIAAQAENEPAAVHRLRLVIFGGEALEVATLKPWYDRNHAESTQLVNMYGITETTVHVTYRPLGPADTQHRGASPIGSRIPDLFIYILDRHHQPVPVGVTGELYIGGAGVARGYLNRPELTAERFLPDPFVDPTQQEPQPRMYKTGDLGRFLPDGNIEFLGRNDFQVKVRGFRIELGEIEARLAAIEGVKEAVVLEREEPPGDKRLIAYYTGSDVLAVETLRSHLANVLPGYMVPAAYVHLTALPLTVNGKLNRKALPAPEDDAFDVRVYEAPAGEVEQTLAWIWSELLHVERIGRGDNFFELGGHSLLAVTLISRMHGVGLHADVRTLFTTPILCEFAAAISGNPQPSPLEVPPNLISADCTHITPELLPLLNLTQADIERIVQTVPQGAANIQDIYPLSPLQEGILFHHLMAQQGDAYLLCSVLAFDTKKRLDGFLDALQMVIQRHDILRTAVLWEGLSEPVQVVWRRAPLPMEEVILNGDHAADALLSHMDPRRHRMDVQKAPLMRAYIAEDRKEGRWLLGLLNHHLIDDNTTLQFIVKEVQAHLLGERHRLSEPLPYRNFVAQALLGVSRKEHEAFFSQMLGTVDEPTAPFGLLDVQQDGSGIAEAKILLESSHSLRLRNCARKMGVSVASLCHLAWAKVLSRLTGRDEVVFGTVLFGRMQGGEGAERAMGMFINTLPVRIVLGDESVEQAVRTTHSLLSRLLYHEHAPLSLAQRCSAVPPLAPLFTALFNYRHIQDSNASNFSEAAWEGMEVLHSEERTNYPVSLDVDDFGEGFALTVQVQEPIDPLRVCGYMHTALKHLTDALEHAPQAAVRCIEVMSEAERQKVLFGWNVTGAQYPKDKCIHQLFEAQAEKTPDALAVVCDDQSMTYEELNKQANRLSHRLIALGVRPDTKVAICVERRLEMVVALLAILKAGGAYVPLDPAYPAERLEFMLKDSMPLALLTQASLKERWGRLWEQVAVIELDAKIRDWEQLSASSPDPRELGLTPKHLACVIYTSGSTGKPKGVMVEHHSVINQIAFMRDRIRLGPDDRFLQFASISFDVSVEEVFTTLASGAALVLRTDLWLTGAGDFWDLCQRHGVSVVDLPTQFWSQLIQDPAPIAESVRQMNLGGEMLSEQALQVWFARSGHRPRLTNLYGPTETTINATLYEPCDVGDWRAIGHPVANTRIYILDRHGRPVPIGVTGELYIGGAGVARGYLNRPELTAERFLPDPFIDPTAQEPSPRMYKTGDLGRFLADGNIEFLGRNDFQVKVRGFRIELGEIKAKLAEIDGIKEAVVLAREGTNGDKCLVAYYTGSEKFTVESLRTHLLSALPRYMVPAAYVRLAALPLTPTGKLDHKALPDPEGDAFSVRAYEAPKGEVEQRLAGIWAELLDIEKIGRFDHFFELGGHSLMAVALISRLHGMGLHADVRTLFATPVLCELAAAVSCEPQSAPIKVPPNLIPPDCDRITPELLPLVDLTQADIERIACAVPGGVANIQDIYPLSPLQEGILFHHLMSRQGDVFQMPSVLAFDTQKRLNGFIDALQMVIDRHDILHTAVQWEGLPEPVQVVWRKAPLPVEEVILSGDNAQEELYNRIDPRRHRMDVRKAPLMRAYMAEDRKEGRWLLGILNHHLAADHTSLELIVKEVQAHLLEEQQHLPEPLSYRNFIAQARYGVSRKEHEAFFSQMLGTVDEPTAPFGLMDVQGDGSGIAEAGLALDSTLCQRLRNRARKMGVSVASMCHLAWAQVLSLLTGRQDVVFGTVLFGRMQGGEGADRVMGMFINTLPVRIFVGDEPVEQAVRATHTLLSQLLHHEHAPMSLTQRVSAVPAPAPLFTALLNYRYSQQGNASHVSETAWEGIKMLYGEDLNNYPFTLHVDDFGEDFGLTAQVQKPIDPIRICGYMHNALAHLMDALEETPQTTVRSVEVMSEVERKQVLFDWNATETEYPKDNCIHELFEAQAEKTPDAMAVVCEEKRMTYKELNKQANRLAHHLIALGVAPDTTVAIGVDRSLEMVVGLLAILKSGGAYVPLDPSYPAVRLEFMLKDSAPLALLTQSALKDRWSNLPGQVVVIELDADMRVWEQLSASNPDPCELGLTPKHLAYVIYTSGSTGKPKGVAIEHRNAVNFISWAQRAFTVDEFSQSLFATSINFDLAVYEWLAPLSKGGTVNLVANALALIEQPCDVTLINTVPSAMAQLVRAGCVPGGTRVVNLAGEALKRGLVTSIFANSGVQTVCNLYGPSETTTYSTWVTMSREKGFVAHIGRPIANTRIYILGPDHRPVPVGVTGELYIGGAGVARGYLNRPELTAERFLPDPFVDATEQEPHPRMYKTGDLGCFLPDGNIEFLGRNDFQVKARGYRIELGEIEARFTEIEGVKQAVVIAAEDSSGDKRLIAYYTGSEELTVETLRSHLANVLPGYMVPAAYVHLTALPLTPNGKPDRKALPDPEGNAFSTRVFEMPKGEVEQRLAGIWAAVFQMKWIGRHDNFFDLGGHSLMAIQVLSMLTQAGIEVQLAALFTHPTIERLAAYIEGEEKQALPYGAVPIRRAGADTPLFLVHDVSGEVLYAPLLARHIDADIPVYGLIGTPLGAAPFRTMYAQAKRFVRIIRAVQPFGPYRIAGWSLGGNLAYEIATQLLGEDETVEFLGLIDAVNSAGIRRKERPPFDDNTLLLSIVLQTAGETNSSSQAQLEMLAKTADLKTFVRTCQEKQLFPQSMSLEDIRNCLVRIKASFHALDEYHPLPIPIPFYLFRALDERDDATRARDTHLGWAQVLPQAQVRVIPVPGTHYSMMSPPQIDVLGKSLTDAMRQAGVAKKSIPARHDAHLITIQAGRGGMYPGFCVPGAGANITDFTHLAAALGEQWPIHGLQPKGLNNGHVPHSTVDAAARAYLRAITEVYPEGPLHLFGHSFGGWVVFEMALDLRAAGREVASVTLIDAEAPEGDGILGREYNRTEVFMQLVELSEQRAECSLNLDADDFDGLDYAAQLKLLHGRLVAVKMVHRRSTPEILRGMVRTFATNLRTTFVPSETYPGPVHLVLVRAAKDDEATCRKKHKQTADGWRRFAPELVTWCGPGNHMTVLKPPHVAALAGWLRSSLRIKFNHLLQTGK